MSKDWVIYGLCWTVAFLLISLIIISYLYRVYVKICCWLFGQITSARIIKCWDSSTSNDNDELSCCINHFVKLKFIYDRTDTLLPKLLKNYTTIYIDGKLHHLPKEICAICLEYIGKGSVIYYHGPFIAQYTVNSCTYSDLREGDTIKIKFHFMAPKYVSILKHGFINITSSYFYLLIYFLLPVAMYFIIWGLIDGVKKTMYALEMSVIDRERMLILSFVTTVIIIIAIMLRYACKEKIWCFSESRELKVASVHDQDEPSDNPWQYREVVIGNLLKATDSDLKLV